MGDLAEARALNALTEVRHTVVCGLLDCDSRHLFELLRRAQADNDMVFRDGPALQATDPGVRHWVTHDTGDLLSGKRIRLGLPDRPLHFIAVVRDFRELLVTVPSWWPAQPLYGFDHALHRSPEGVVTCSDPGLAYIAEVLRNGAKKGHLTVVRIEDLLADPDAIQQRLQALWPQAAGRRFSDIAGELPAPAAWPHPPQGEHGWTPAPQARRVLRQFRLSPGLFDTLQRLNYASSPQWFEQLSAAHPEAADDTPGTVVGYYTAGTRYEVEAQRLRSSVQALGLQLELVAVPSPGDWLASVRLKPQLLLALRQRLRGPLLYVDVDAVVHSNPWPYLRGLDADVGVASHHATNVISGTVLLNDTPGAVQLLQAWIADQDRNPTAWDQHSLHNVVYAAPVAGQRPVRVQHLPLEMCRVFDRRYHPRVGNVIEHLQASREMRVADGTERSRDALARRHARLRELAGELAGEQTPSPAQSPPMALPPAAQAFATLPAPVRRERTEALMASGRSDTDRWAEPQNLKQAWSQRAATVAALVEGCATVLDLGCGNMDLERALGPGVEYIPSDLVRRDDRTHVCDLNRGEWPAVHADVATLVGVMEYVHDPAALLAGLAARWPRIVLTYNPADLDRGRDRRSHGWVHDLTSAQLVALAHDAGLDLQVLVPFEPRQCIYDFARRPEPR